MYSYKVENQSDLLQYTLDDFLHFDARMVFITENFLFSNFSNFVLTKQKNNLYITLTFKSSDVLDFVVKSLLVTLTIVSTFNSIVSFHYFRNLCYFLLILTFKYMEVFTSPF